MKKNIYILLTFLIMLPLGMHAQKEMNWWYFGANSGLNFNETQTVTSSAGVATSGMPKAVTGPFNTIEGCFTLSDSKGNLVMSSDGSKVYNKRNEVMTNGTGLLGQPSATQAGIVVPAPNNPNKFYVITLASQEVPAAGMRYSVVNINVNDPNDLGSVEENTKNTVLRAGLCAENVAAVTHKNGTDYWLVHRTAHFFYVWLITEQGFSDVPQTFQIPTLPFVAGKLLGGFPGETIFSVDNTKLVNFARQVGSIISADFDAGNGVISDIRVRTNMTYPYAGTFSPSGEYLYYSGGQPEMGFKIKYNDLRSGTLAPINLGLSLANFSLGPDERVYAISNYSANDPVNKYLFVMMNPNEGGTDIRIFPSYLTNRSFYGLPNFGSSFYSKLGKVRPFSCSGYEAKLAITVSMSGVNIPTRLIWNFGDGVLKEQSFIAGKYDYDMNHLFTTSGLKKITVTPYKGTSALASSSFYMNIIDCDIKTNRMIRQDLLNIDQLEINK